MKSGYDITRLKGDGYLVLPLSMSRLQTGQSPEACYEFIHHFTTKLERFGSDVVFLYTQGLYFNSEEVSFENRKKTTQQALNHVSALRNIIEKDKRYIPSAFHYLPIDYVILNSPVFAQYFSLLKERENHDEEFRNILISDSRDKTYSEANINFLIEEIAVAHITRQGLVEFPHTLAQKDTWRLVCYPGPALGSDRYQWQQKILPQRSDNPYADVWYDLSSKTATVYSDTTLQ